MSHSSSTSKGSIGRRPFMKAATERAPTTTTTTTTTTTGGSSSSRGKSASATKPSSTTPNSGTSPQTSPHKATEPAFRTIASSSSSSSHAPSAPTSTTAHVVTSGSSVRKSVQLSEEEYWRERAPLSKEIPVPARQVLQMSDVFAQQLGEDGKMQSLPRMNVLKDHFFHEGRISEEAALSIIRRAELLLRREPNILTLQDPITVCGDIHGQFYDLLKLFDIGGNPLDKNAQYLFLGDYVDRGYFSCEVALYLLSFKLHRPNAMFMLRGNHECRHLTAFFNFKHECEHKYSGAVYDAFMLCFDALPLCAILNGRFFCVHGGLSPELSTIDQISRIDRFTEPPQSGLFCDLLWSDPMDEDDEDDQSSSGVYFADNTLRGCSYVFSYNAVCQFLATNNLLSVIRAHEAQDEGYRLYRRNATTGFPTIITLFSAAHYIDCYHNKGAIIRFQNNQMNIRQFMNSPHPYWLPNFMNVFDWSLPFVAEKVTDMLLTILNLVDDTDDDEEMDDKPAQLFNNASAMSPLELSSRPQEPQHQPSAAQQKQKQPPAPPSAAQEQKPPATEQQTRSKIDPRHAEIIRSKIRTVGRLSRMYRTLREERESIIVLKGLAGGTIPQGILSLGPDALKNAISDFSRTREMDKKNEMRPPSPNLSSASAGVL